MRPNAEKPQDSLSKSMPRGQKQFPTNQVEIRQIDCQLVFQFQAAPLWIGDSMRHFSIIKYLVKQCVILMSKICYICFIMRFWEYIVVAKILLLLECKHRGLRGHHGLGRENTWLFYHPEEFAKRHDVNLLWFLFPFHWLINIFDNKGWDWLMRLNLIMILDSSCISL